MKLLKKTLFGIGIGSFIYILLSLFFVTQEIRVQIIGVLLCSAIMGACSQIYEVRRLSLLIQTMVDFLLRYAAVMIIGIVFGWFPFLGGALITATVIFLVIFFLFWTSFYLYERHQYQKFNQRKQLDSK